MTTDWIISADSHVQEPPPSLYEERVDQPGPSFAARAAMWTGSLDH